MKSTSLLVLMLILKVVDEMQCDCVLSLKDDFGSPSAVYLHGDSYLLPGGKKGVSVRRAAAITVACPGRAVVLGNYSTGVEDLEVKCVSNTTFSAGARRWRGEFKAISCSSQPYFTALETRQACYRSGQTSVKVGYTVAGKLYTLYTACFDRGTMSTLFVQHDLSPSSFYSQIGRRPQFTGGDLFGKFPIADLYKLTHQKDRINAVLGSNMDSTYLTKKEFLTRGHLAANADFSLRALKRASFHYVNVAPQWKRGNSGDWAAFEDGLRRRVHSSNSSVTVYTGTHGVLRLPSPQGEKEFYLHTDENNNDVAPVPLYFYKLVYDPKRKTATAFVTVNSSFYNQTTTDRLTFCDDVCGAISWLKLRNDGTHSFCCSYEDFVETVDHVVGLDVKGLYK
ncbi:hypothetical protein MSG28_014571 [Choristoneura fumiferana]|uniref:Uncharacterized protein n=1 Tax=Choristoneura fumiferana TaxID=7141 RepID=A0ACC0JSB8_CHOFU|nr:hypothetical protein MSG28_014571 [Choristoneura fumiferana]